MKFGLAPTQSEPTFDTMCAQARLADDLGFDCLWAHEHHSEGMMYPDPLMTLAALAGETKRIGLGTNMLLQQRSASRASASMLAWGARCPAERWRTAGPCQVQERR